MIDRRIFTLVIATIIAGGLTACGPKNTASTYTEEQIGRAATVMKGKIIAVREVTIQGASSGAGATGGAIAGGAAAASVPGDPFLAVAAGAGGALVGGVAGAVTEQTLRRSGAVELIVEQENGQIIAVVQTNEQSLTAGEQVLVLRSDRVRVIRNQSIP